MYKEYILDEDDDDDEPQKPQMSDFLGSLNELCNNEAKYMER